VGKKIPEEMAKQHKIFVEGCKKHSDIPTEKAEEIWKLFEPFQGYGFNKAHAASYGRLAYQTAYMKANFPAIYMSSVLTADSGDVEKIGETITECKRIGIPVLPPSVNESYAGFSVVRSGRPENDKIRFGLTTIKNFGEGIAKIIIEERKKSAESGGGKFKSLSDFLRRVKDRNLNKKSIEALVMSGALDEFGERGQMLANMEKILAFVKEEGNKSTDQSSLFGSSDQSSPDELKLDKAEPAKTEDKLAWEKELLGLYISGHPLDKFRAVLEKRDVNIKKVKEEMKEGMIVVVGGILEEIRTTITKKNDQMAFAKISDFSGGIDTVFFPKVYEEFKSLIVGEACIAVKGRISDRNGEKSIIVEKVKKLT
jgi:DNA polymerase-3 subunit alpha